MILNKYIKELT